MRGRCVTQRLSAVIQNFQVAKQSIKPENPGRERAVHPCAWVTCSTRPRKPWSGHQNLYLALNVSTYFLDVFALATQVSDKKAVRHSLV
jgi:hypothetical protein